MTLSPFLFGGALSLSSACMGYLYRMWRVERVLGKRIEANEEAYRVSQSVAKYASAMTPVCSFITDGCECHIEASSDDAAITTLVRSLSTNPPVFPPDVPPSIWERE